MAFQREGSEKKAAAKKLAEHKAPVIALKSKAKKETALESSIFGGEVRPHLIHEVVRAEANAARAGTFASKSRGMVSGGRAKPWRQKGTGRARAGTIRAAQFTGGGHVFAKVPRSFAVKVNRKAARAALRSALASHASSGTLTVIDATSFTEPSTKAAKSLVAASGLATPIVVVMTEEEVAAAKSFRNLERVAVVDPSMLEVGAVVWARSLIISEASLPLVQQRAS